MNVYVGNLPFSYESSNLATLFAQFGDVKSADVVMDRHTGRSRGFGFVEMSDDEARKAIEALDGKDVDGRALTVNEARPRSTDGARGGNRGPRRDDRGGRGGSRSRW